MSTKLYEQWKWLIGTENADGQKLTSEELRRWAESNNPQLECVFCGDSVDTDLDACYTCGEYKGLQPKIGE